MDTDPYPTHYLNSPLLHVNDEHRALETLARLVGLQSFYTSKKIPIHYFYQSLYDLNYRLVRYFDQHKIYGLSQKDIRWLTPLFNGEIFDLCSLRFQLSYFDVHEIERSGYDAMVLSKPWKEYLPQNTPIITIHILKDADLRPHKVEESLRLAKSFFKAYFNDHLYEVLVCRTWMLYEPTSELLPSSSNIVQFAKRFKIIAKNNNAKQALDRIYGCDDLDIIKRMKKTSSLARLAYKNVDKLGVAAGIIHKNEIGDGLENP